MTQAALSVLAAIRKKTEFIGFLYLAKAYDTVLKLLMKGKLDETVDPKLANKLIIFLLTVKKKQRWGAAGDIFATEIEILRGLTQSSTSSPALFNLFINDFPAGVRVGLREVGMAAAG